MKRTFAIMMMCIACLTISAQTSDAANKKFMKRFESLIERMNKYEGENEDSIAAWKSERSKIATLYKERYRASFSDEQLEDYASLTAQYKSRMTELRLGGLSEEMDSLGSRVGRGVRRAGKKVSGFIDGVKKQSDKNRRKSN